MNSQQKTGGALLATGSLIVGIAISGPVMLGQLAGTTFITNTACTSAVTDSAQNEQSSTSAINVPEEYKEPLKKAAEDSGIPEEILAAQIKQESNFNAQAVSPVGAKGPAQFMPATWEAYGNGGDITNVSDAVAAMGRYMKDLKGMVEKYAGEDATKLIQLTLAAYNAGPGNVEKYSGIPPFTETQHYIEVITAGAQVEYSSTCSSVAVAWDGDLGDGEWTSPLPNSTMSSGYGPRSVPGLPAWAQQHVGIDLLTGSGFSPGGPVVAPTDLDITGYFQPDHCVLATAKDGSDLRMAFCHLHESSVEPGQEVKKGDILGIEGNYGESVATVFITHLHYEIYKPGEPLTGANYNPYNGQTLNPEPILKEKGAWNF